MGKIASLLFVIIAEIVISAPSAEAKKPLPPTEFQATKSLKADGAVELNWHAVKGATGYTISASRENDENWHDVGNTTELEFQVNELPEATKYYFRIASNTKSDQSDWSTAVVQYSSGQKRIHTLRLPSKFNRRESENARIAWSMRAPRVRVSS